MDGEMTKEEFMKLPTEEIRKIVEVKGFPKVGVIIPDGNRRYAMAFLNVTPKSKTFEIDYMRENSKKFIRNIQVIFDHGLNTLFVPCMKHENFYRDEGYIKAITQFSLKLILTDEKWLDFYKKNNIKVKVYGDLNYVSEKGHSEIIRWAKNLEKETSKNSKYRLFYGIACSNKFEYPRLMDLAIEFYTKHKKIPSYDEKINLYYGEKVDDVDLFIRPTAIRDSDIQPPLISGHKTQMYFLVAPDSISFNKNVFREILYDTLFCRTNVLGIRTYKNEIMKK
ncbi:MAG: undecaprenyl diphosphate synthase family protein, partial [Thermoplasmata archaeon]|nr:undecaprenyl diphosphate synthase family protein [Thermoplasmata archaeon]